MALSAASKLSAVMADPNGTEVLEKYIPGFSKDKRVALMKNLTLKQLQPMSQGMVSPEMLVQIDEELQALE